MPGQVTTPVLALSNQLLGLLLFEDKLTQHVQRPLQVSAGIVEHRAEASRKDCEENDAKMAPVNDLAVRGGFVEVLAVDVEADDGTHGNDLRR